MAVNSRKSTVVRGDLKQINGRKNRRTTSAKHSSPAQHKRLQKVTSKKRTAISHPNRPGTSRTSVSGDYNPTRLAITDLNIPPENRRIVLCDGENIAYDDITREYYANRMYEAYQWFVSIGYDALVLCPDYLPQKLIGPLPSMRMEMVTGIFDDGQNHSTNEPFELALLQRANEAEAAIVSERSFVSTYHNFEDVVKSRVIGFAFCRGSIFIPVDPYGRAGPWLREILWR